MTREGLDGCDSRTPEIYESLMLVGCREGIDSETIKLTFEEKMNYCRIEKT